MSEEMMHCRTCDREKPIDQFALYPGKPGQRIALCKMCRSERQRAHMLGKAPKRVKGPILPPLEAFDAPTSVPTVESLKERLLRGRKVVDA